MTTARAPTDPPCDHLLPGPRPWTVVSVFDSHLGPADFLARCHRCGVPYIFELYDLSGARRLFRIRAPAPDASELLLRDLERGSCDLGRAGEEVRQLVLASPQLPFLLLFDSGADALERVIALAADIPIPGGSWRDLGCDGSRIKALEVAGTR